MQRTTLPTNVMKKNNKNRGMALVGAILMMVVLVILGTGMLMITWFETRSETSQRLGEMAFYVADGGIENAIYRIQNKNYQDFEIDVGTTTGNSNGVARVSVVQSGSIYTVTSTGYVPKPAQALGERTIRARVEVQAGLPNYATMTEGRTDFAANTEVRGVIFSNDPVSMGSGVVFKPDKEGNVALYSARTIDIGNNFDFDPDNNATGIREILAREEIFNNTRIPDDVHWNSPDYTEKTDPIDEVEFVDAQAMIDDEDTIENYDFGGKVNITGGRANFQSGYTYNLDGGTYYYPGGLNVDSNVEFIGDGSFVVGPDGDTDHHGIDIRSNVQGDGKVNWIVSGGEWKDGIDINIESNVDPVGIIQCPGDISLSSNVELTGIVAAGGNLDASSNVEITYEDDLFMPPLKDTDGAGGVKIISWTEL